MSYRQAWNALTKRLSNIDNHVQEGGGRGEMRSAKVTVVLALFLVLAVTVILVVGQDNMSMEARAKNLAGVLSTRDIRKVDDYFRYQTIFLFQDESAEYPDVRSNLEAVFGEGKVRFRPTASYITKYFSSESENHEVNIIAWPEVRGKGSVEINIRAKFRKTGLFEWSIIRLESSDPEFGYLFFDRTMPL